LREVAGSTTGDADMDLVKKFATALDDDLNVSAAWGSVFDWVREANRRLAANELSKEAAASALAAWAKIDSVFGLGQKQDGEAPAEIQAFLEQRQAARKAKDFKRADQLRDELKARGWLIEDTPKGPKLKKS
jgi:cysteinyl-tRNA synthetase